MRNSGLQRLPRSVRAALSSRDPRVAGCAFHAGHVDGFQLPRAGSRGRPFRAFCKLHAVNGRRRHASAAATTLDGRDTKHRSRNPRCATPGAQRRSTGRRRRVRITEPAAIAAASRSYATTLHVGDGQPRGPRFGMRSTTTRAGAVQLSQVVSVSRVPCSSSPKIDRLHRRFFSGSQPVTQGFAFAAWCHRHACCSHTAPNSR